MNRNTGRGIALFGTLSCVLLLGFSDTAQAQTITVNPATLNFSLPSGGASLPQTVHVTTSNDPNTVIVQVPSGSSWIHVNGAQTAIVNTPTSPDLQVTVSGLSTGVYQGTFTLTINGIPSSQTFVTVNATVGGTSILSASPSSLSFTGQVGATQGSPQGCASQATPSTCQVVISSSGGQLNFNVTLNPSNSWLLIDRTSGTTGTATNTLNVGVNPSAVTAAGTYNGTIQVQSTTTGDSVVIPVTLTVGAAPTLSVMPTGPLQFLYQTGTSLPASKTLTVTSNDGFVPFNVSQNLLPSWLTVAPISGSASSTSPATLTVSVNPTSPIALQPGNYSAQIVITPQGGQPLPAITVNLTVSGNPFLTVAPTSLSFSSLFGGTPPATQQVTVASSGSTAINFSAAAASTPAWLTVTPTSGTTPSQLTIGVNQTVLNQMAVGMYNGTVTLTPLNGDQYTIQIPVMLIITSSSTVIAAPSALVFSYQGNQAQPAAQTVQLFTAGAPVSFSVTSVVNAQGPNCTGAWLSASAQASQTPTLLTVSIFTPGILQGTCNGTVQIKYGNNQETDIPVTLFVTSSTPLLNISLPQGFGYETATLNSTTPITRQIGMTSTDGVTAIPYTVSFQSAVCTWLLAGPSSGSTPQPVTVQILPGCLSIPGTYQGSITITSATGLPMPVTLNVTLVISANVTVTVSPTSLTFTQPQGAPAPAAQTLTFTATGGNAAFIATPVTDFGGNWLSVTPTSGNTSATLSVTAGSTTLPPNTYTGRVVITFQGAVTQSLTVPVTLTVTGAQTVTVSPSSLTFSFTPGGIIPPSQALSVSSAGGPVNFTVITASSGWLSTDTPSTGCCTTPRSINVSVNPQNVPVGSTVSGTITITPANLTPITVNVTLTVAATPPPQITTVTNSASGLPGPISAGELITLKGVGLGPATPASGTSFRINASGGVDPTLAGVQVLFNGNLGTPTFVSAAQINVIVPWEIAGSLSTTIVVSNQGIMSAAIQQSVTNVAPAIYTWNGNGQGQAVVGNLTGPTAGTFNGPVGGITTTGGQNIRTSPAAPGSFIYVLGTGAGQTNPRSITGSVNSSTTIMPLAGWSQGSNTVTATIGGIPVPFVQFAGAAPGIVNGVAQFNLQVPLAITGPSLPIVITVNGQQTQIGATVAVQ